MTSPPNAIAPRPSDLIATLGLAPHPEGGWFREIHRSSHSVLPDDGRPERSSVTVIYFLLVRGMRTRWHRVASDEVWQFVEGAELELTEVADGAPAADALRVTLGPLAPGVSPVRVVPAQSWQAARSRGDYSLVTCTVAPGFDFADFEMRDG